MNGNVQAKRTYKTFLARLKKEGWGTPKTTTEKSDPALAGTDRLIDTRC